MSQQTLELLSDERVEPSLLESRYPEIIASVGSLDSDDSIISVGSIDSVASIDSVDLIDSEDFLPVEYFSDSGDSFDLEYSLDSGYFLEAENSLTSEYSLESGDSISFQEIEVDFLTGIPNDLTVSSKTKTPKRTTALYDPRLTIKKFSYNNLAEVTATVRVELSPFVRFCIEQDFVDITLEASVWGMDGGVFGKNSHLFNFSNKLITGEGTYTFRTSVNSNVLDEDTGLFQGGPTDEIATKFRLTSSDPALIGVNLTAWTPEVSGRF
jgi:hypothetical protein